MLHRPRNVALLCGLIITALLTAACQPAPAAAAADADPWGTVRVPAGDVLQLAVALAGEDTAAGDSGVEQLRGVELALAEQPEVEGFAIRARVVDAGCSASVGIGAATRVLADARNVAVIGHSCSSSCETAAPLYENAHLTMLSPACSAPALTDNLLHVGSFLRTMHDETLEAAAAARFVYEERGARRAVILTDGTDRAETLGGTFEAEFSALGGKVTERLALPSGEQNFRPVLQAASASEPDVIFAPLEAADGARAVMQARTTAAAETPFIGTQLLISEWFTQEAGRLVEGTYAVGPVLEGAQYEAVLQRYEATYNEAPTEMSFAFGYDAATLMLNAIRTVAVLDTNGDLLIGKQALRDALYNSANFPGITGPLTCNRWGECSAANLAVWQAGRSSWEVVYLP